MKSTEAGSAYSPGKLHCYPGGNVQLIQYTILNGSVASDDIGIDLDKEVAPDEVWALILDVGEMPPI